jgi:hypothetical protein
MTAVVVLLAAVVAVQTVLVAGLLRSHAVILRRLHDLGAGVGDPTGAPVPARPDMSESPAVPATAQAARTGREAHDLVGVDPDGDAIALRVVDAPHLTVLAFLSSSCLTCSRFWDDLRKRSTVALPDGARLVVVTKGPEAESPTAIANLAPRGFTTVMATAAWDDYQVPGSPYVVAVDGPNGRVIGEGTGSSWTQVAGLLAEATGDLEWAVGANARRPRKHRADAEREAALDAALLAAGIAPGDPRLVEPLDRTSPAPRPSERPS